MDLTGETPSPLTIIVVNWNGVDLLPGCLNPLTGAGFEVIVVDNGSTDASKRLLRESFPWVKIIANPDNRGFAAANNQGLQLAGSALVLLLNNDTIPDRAALTELVGFLEYHPEVGVAGPSLVFPDGRPQPSCGPGPNLWTEVLSKTMLHRLLPGLRAKAPAVTSRVDWVTGAALCIRRDLALELGGLDEAMFMFYEDLDLCARVREAGSQVFFVATPPVLHIGGATRRRVETDSLVQSYQSSAYFFSKHGPAWRKHLIRGMTVPEMVLRTTVWAALSVSPSQRRLARERLSAYRRILGLARSGI
jgi:GT2 family glycosyltransferase